MEERDRLDPDVRRQEDRAAAEAGAIGGEGANEDLDPADRPLAESGQGVAEGFERAEGDLAENAEHGEGGGDPELDALPTEDESGGTGAAYGEADRVEVTESERRLADADAQRYETDPNEPDPAPRPDREPRPDRRP